MRAALLFSALSLAACTPDKAEPRATSETVRVERVVHTPHYTLDRVTTRDGVFYVADGNTTVIQVQQPVEGSR